MSNFAIEGLISGFNTSELIQAMLDVQVRGPIKEIERRIEKELERYNAFQQLNANMLGLDVAAQGLRSATLFGGREAISTNPSIVNASASNSAPVGNFTIRVDNLAKADQISSDLFLDPNEELNMAGQFILNGRTITLRESDTLRTMASQINSSGAGVNASVVEVSPNQHRLIMTASETGVNKLSLRDVGPLSITTGLGLTDNTARVDFTVNASNLGALSAEFDPAETFDFTGKSIGIRDAGGQHKLTVNFSGELTLAQIADEINAASLAQGTNLSASIQVQGGQQRLQISSTTGIPTQFEDPDNAFFELGILTGVQSAAFSSSVRPIAELQNLSNMGPSTFRIYNGDQSDFREVTIDLSVDTLTTIAEKINQAAEPPPPGSDISARVISAGGISRLEIKSASGHPIFGEDDNNVLGALGIVDRNFKHYDQRGENSQFAYNGVTVNRTSNNVTDLIEGITISLQQESFQPVTINVNRDFSHVKDAVSSFVEAYNTVNEFLREVSKFDPNEGNGVLFGNDTVRRLRSEMSSALSMRVPNLPSMLVSELNNGSGIQLGRIKITDRNGASGIVDLTGVRTVKDVIDAINGTDGIDVRAAVTPNGTSINLTDRSKGVGAFKVEEVDGGTTGKDLGLLGQAFSNQLAGKVIADSSYTSLDFVGITLNTDGSLTFSDSVLQRNLNEKPELAQNFLTADAVGFGRKFLETIGRFTAFNVGILDTTTNAITDRIEMFNKRIESIESRSQTLERTLRRQFSALEVTLSQSQQLSQLLDQRLSGMNN